MSQRPFSPVTNQPFKVENYYFQIIPCRLNAKTVQSSRTVSYVFTVFKGSKKFETSRKVALTLGGTAFPLESIKLNFVVINYNPNKREQFALRISEVTEEVEKQVGEFLIDGNSFIDHFLHTENGAFKLQGSLNDEFQVDLQLYVEKSRYGVERLIKDIKNPRPKSTQEKQITHQVLSVFPKMPENPQQPLQQQQMFKMEPSNNFKDKPLSKEQVFNQKVTDLKQTEQQQYRPLLAKENYTLTEKRNKFAEPAMLKSQTFSVNLSQNKPKDEVKLTRTKREEIQQKWYQKIPFNIKFAVPILLLLLAGFYFAFSSDEPQQLSFPKAASEKVSKTTKKARSRKGKK